MSQIFNTNDRVKFKGDAENVALEETIVAWSNNETRQAIIQHPDGHSGSEIPNRGLRPDGLYVFVQFSKLELIEKAITLETVSNEMEKKRPLDRPFIPLSDVLKLIKERRPAEDHELLTKLINICEQDEEQKKAAQKAKDADLHKKQIEDIESGKNLENIKNATVLAPSVAERLSAEEEQRQNIVEIIENAVEIGAVKFDGPEVWHFNNLIFTETGGADANAIGLANYFQNVPTEFAEFCKNQILMLPKRMDTIESDPEVLEPVNETRSAGKRLEKLNDLKGIGKASLAQIANLYGTNAKLDTLADKLQSGDSGLDVILAGKLLKFVEGGLKF